MSSADSIIQQWKKKAIKPCYLFHGEDSYHTDLLMKYAEEHLLSTTEQAFNLTIFYGREAEWTNVVNASRRYPIQSEWQVVMIKEAQLMNGIEKLESYLEKPMPTTVFLLGYMGKKMDKRSKLYKLFEKHGEVVESIPVPDYQMHGWVEAQIKKMGLEASGKTIDLLVSHIGNDLSRMVHEIEKLAINLKGSKRIEEKDVELYIGISREYNAFELQQAIATKNLASALRIIQYFSETPKDNPIHKILPALYSFFGKVHAAFGLNGISESTLKPHFYNNPYATRQAMTAMQQYGLPGIERIILLMQHYNLKSLGINDAGTEDAVLMQEMVSKMMLD